MRMRGTPRVNCTSRGGCPVNRSARNYDVRISGVRLYSHSFGYYPLIVHTTSMFYNSCRTSRYLHASLRCPASWKHDKCIPRQLTHLTDVQVGWQIRGNQNQHITLLPCSCHGQMSMNLNHVKNMCLFQITKKVLITLEARLCY